MAQILPTIEQYIATTRQQTTIWMVFNTVYNDLHGFDIKIPSNEISSKYLKKQYTDNETREEFLDFMKTNFADIKLVEVFDLVDVGYIQWPYLGSIAIDTDIGSDCYNALCDKYGDPYEDPISNKALLWVMEYAVALAFYDKKEKIFDEEFGD